MNYLSREFTFNLLSISRIHFHLTFFIANSFWIPYLLCEFTFNSLSISRIHFEFTIFVANSLSKWPNHIEFTFFSRIYIEFTMFFTNLLRIHFLFHEFTFNPLSFSRFEYSLSLLSICFLFRDSNFIRIHHLYRVFTCTSYQTFANSLSIHKKFSIVFKNSFLIPYLRKLTSN